MTKTSAQRQAKYRAGRMVAGDNGERRINTWVTTRAALALARLANHNGITQRAILEQLLIAAQDNVQASFKTDAEFDAYYQPRRSA